MLKSWTRNVRRCAAWIAVAMMLAERSQNTVFVELEDRSLALPGWTVHSWTLSSNPVSSLLPSALCMYISAWVGQITHSRTYVTHLLFHEHTDVLYSSLVPVSLLLYMFWRVFLMFGPFFIFGPSSCLWHLCLAFFIFGGW